MKNMKSRILSFILVICLILTGTLSTNVFGADWSGFWTFSSGRKNTQESPLADTAEESAKSVAGSSPQAGSDGSDRYDAVGNADTITTEDAAYWEDEEDALAAAAKSGDMYVYESETDGGDVSVKEDVSLVCENESVIVTLAGAKDDLPADASVSVTEILPTDEASTISYISAFTALSETLQSTKYSDARLYDITLRDKDGSEIEPSGPVSVRIEYKDAETFASIDKESIKVAHIADKDEKAESEDTDDDGALAKGDALDSAAAAGEEYILEDAADPEDRQKAGQAAEGEALVGASAGKDADPENTREADEEPAALPTDAFSDEGLAAAYETASGMTAEIVETTVEQTAESEPVSLTFVTDSFSYYIVFGGNGSDTEPADIGNYGWVRFATTGVKDTAWGFYQSESEFPAYTDTNNRTRRIFSVRLWFPNDGVTDPEAYDETAFHHPDDATAQYYWLWPANNQVVIDEFEIPGYEVVHSSMHTAWNDANGNDDVQGDGLEGVYPVRGFVHGLYDQLVAEGQVPGVDFQPYDLNILDVYLKELPTHGNVDTTHYVIRYVHADGSVSDGNEKELWDQDGYRRAYFDQSTYCRDNEVYAGFTLATGNEAVHDESGSTNLVTLQNEGKGYIEYNSQSDLAKVTIYYKSKPDGLGTNAKNHYDRDTDSGKYYTGEKGLYTDKSVEPVSDSDGRHYLLNLESWYVDQAVSVGMVLDSSGSMAWTSGVPEPIILTDEQAWVLGNYTDPDNNYISDLNLLNWVLNPEKTDNSMLNYNGYHYYLFDERDSVNEYVALGYWAGGTNNFTQLPVLNNNGTTTNTNFIILAPGRYAVPSFGSERSAGWYYVNSTGKTPEFLAYTGKTYEGNPYWDGSKWNRRGPLHFYVVTNSEGKKELWCTYLSNSQKKYSQVYEKRYKMFTKNETLQDALAQFGTILLGSSTVNRIAMTRFSQDIVATDDTGATDTSRYFRAVNGSSTGYLKLLNWTNSTIDVAAALNQDPTASGGTLRDSSNGPGLAGTYGYGLTGQTTTYAGVKAFINEYKDSIDEARKKYIIIFTDGKDLHRNSAASDADDTATQGLTGNLVRQLKNEGFSIVTVLMKSQTFNAPGSESDYEKTQNFLRALASYGKQTDDTGSPLYETPDNKLYFEADSNSSYELVQEFREIANRITSSLKEYNVIDYIDPRFDVTNDAGRILTVLDENGEFTSETNPEVDENGLDSFTTPDGKKAYLGYDSERKMFYVLWDDQTILSTTVNSEIVVPWKSQIRIQAKEDFLGGNEILTNGNDPTLNKVFYSGYDTNSSTNPPVQYPAKVFPQTAANPAILDESLDYTEDTIYLGEAIDPSDKFRWLFDTPSNDNLYLEYLKRYVSWGEYLGSDEFRQSSDYTSLDTEHQAEIDVFVDTYNAIKSRIEDFVADGAEDIAATEDEPESKAEMTLTVPYYYLEDSRGNENQPGTMWHMLDRIGEISYTWEAADDVPDPYIKRATTTDDPDPIVYTLKASYKADSIAVHEARASWLAAQNLDGITPNIGQYFNMKDTVINDPEDTSYHYAGTILQNVGEGRSPTINKRIYLSELENDPDDSADISSTLVDKVMHYLMDAENNTNGQKDYPFTVSGGGQTAQVTLRIQKPQEGAADDVKLSYQWITQSGEQETVLAEGTLTDAMLLAAAADGYIDLSYVVTSLVVPDDNNPNTKNTVQYSIVDENAGRAITNLASGNIGIQKYINKNQVLSDIANRNKQGVLLEFKLKRTYIDPMYEPEITEEPDPEDTEMEEIEFPGQDPEPTPLPGQTEEYYRLQLVLGGMPLPTPTPTPDPEETPAPNPTPTPTPVPYDRTITATVSAADLEALEEDDDGNIAITPDFGLSRLPIGTYEIEEIYAGGYMLEGFTDITPDGTKKAYVEVAEDGQSAVIYLNQVVSDIPAEATIDSTRKRLNAQEALLKVVNTSERGTYLKLTKRDSVDDSLLENVLFEIFEDEACTTKVPGTTDAEGNEADVFVTDENGVLTIDNLDPAPNKTYYLREKKAASGHYLLVGAIPVSFNSSGELVIGEIPDPELASHVRLDTDTEEDLNDMIVTNSPFFDLPSAGGPGNYIFTILGIAVCTMTVLIRLRDRRTAAVRR